jgi:hypothetical protein
VAALLMETLFLRYRLLPFVSAGVPGGELKARALSATALLTASSALAWIEQVALVVPAKYLPLVATVIALSVGVRAIDCSSHRPAGPLDLDEKAPFPTQRLDLAS